MSYATTADMRDRFDEAELRQLTDDAGAGVIDDARLQRALDDAGDLINAHLAARYDVPIAPAPKLLTRLQCDIARRYLYRDEPPAGVKDAHDQAVRTLERLADGRMSLGLDAEGGETAQPASGGPQLSASDRVFGRDSLRGF